MAKIFYPWGTHGILPGNFSEKNLAAMDIPGKFFRNFLNFFEKFKIFGPFLAKLGGGDSGGSTQKFFGGSAAPGQADASQRLDDPSGPRGKAHEADWRLTSTAPLPTDLRRSSGGNGSWHGRRAAPREV